MVGFLTPPPMDNLPELVWSERQLNFRLRQLKRAYSFRANCELLCRAQADFNATHCFGYRATEKDLSMNRLRKSGLLSVLMTAVLLVMSGCSTLPSQIVRKGSIPTSPTLQGATFDEQASSYTTSKGEQTTTKDLEPHRAEITAALNDLIESRPDGLPARFRLKMTKSEGSVWPLAACMGILIIFGCPMEVYSRTVDLEVEVSGKRYSATGEGKSVGYFYSPAWVRATAEAITNALRKIDAQMVANPAGEQGQ